MSKALLIALTGIDGSGKSTLARALCARFALDATREPTSGPEGQRIRSAFASGRRLPPSEERALFEADRRRHVAERIAPALSRGDSVLTDRYYHCTAAYQGASHAEARAIALANEAFAPRPQVIVHLDLPAAFALARLQARGALEATDRYETLRDVGARYAELWEDPAIVSGVALVRLDARQAADVVADRAITALVRLGVAEREASSNAVPTTS